MDILETVTFVGSIFIVIYLFMWQPHRVQGASMDNTFHDGQYIITSKISYRIGKPQIGDVVVFKSPNDPDYDFIKRIIGIPGDKISIASGKVTVNGFQLPEDYAQKPTNTFNNGFIGENEEIIVPEGAYFVLGDNRPRSSDSRDWGFVARSSIVGKVVFRYFPFDKMGFIENPYSKKVSTIPNLNKLSFIPDYSLY